MNSVPRWACSKVPVRRPPANSEPNSSVSIRSGAMLAALTTTSGWPARRERAWTMRATTSLPEPGGPLMRIRLPVGATFSIAWRSAFMTPDSPTSRLGWPTRRRNSSFSRRNRAVSMARSTTTNSWPVLNGFSM